MGKLKKILRKVGKGVKKAAPIALLALSAAALAKRRKAKALNAITDYGDTGPLSGKAGYEGMDYLAPKKRYVNPNEETLAAGAPKKTYLQKGKDVGTAIPKIYAPEGEFLAKGGRVGVGKAKRGFGRALRKK
jgi:hypothetical protein